MFLQIVIGFLLCLLLFFLYAFYRLYQTLTKKIPEFPTKKKDFTIQPEVVTFKSDGNTLSGWFFKKNKSKGTIIYVHGHGDPNGGKANDYKYVKGLLSDTYNLFIFDLRGFGTSGFVRHSMGFNESNDVVKAIEYISNRKDIKDQPIYLLGSSMGAVSSIGAANKTDLIKALIVLAPFKSLSSLLNAQVKKEGFPTIPFVWFLNLAAMILISPEVHKRTAESLIKNVHVPLLYLQGEKDEVINQNDYKVIYSNAPEPKELHVIKNGEHNTFASHPKQLETLIFSFIHSLESHDSVHKKKKL